MGAATFGNGSVGITGTVTGFNSLVGSTNDDFVAQRVTPLTNGNYVVGSPAWQNGTIAVGAATFASGSVGITGTISSLNSLIASSL
jgi:hypothetical protein